MTGSKHGGGAVTVAAWAVLVPAGTVLLAAGLILALPAIPALLLGVWCWKAADRLLRHRAPDDEVGDDTVAIIRAYDDAQWQAYLSHPSVRGHAARHVRGER